MFLHKRAAAKHAKLPKRVGGFLSVERHLRRHAQIADLRDQSADRLLRRQVVLPRFKAAYVREQQLRLAAHHGRAFVHAPNLGRLRLPRRRVPPIRQRTQTKHQIPRRDHSFVRLGSSETTTFGYEYRAPQMFVQSCRTTVLHKRGLRHRRRRFATPIFPCFDVLLC